MKHQPVAGKRRSVNLSLDEDLVAAARECGINLSRVSEEAIRSATIAARAALWKEQNRQWIDAHREWVENNPLPLEHLRPF